MLLVMVNRRILSKRIESRLINLKFFLIILKRAINIIEEKLWKKKPRYDTIPKKE